MDSSFISYICRLFRGNMGCITRPDSDRIGRSKIHLSVPCWEERVGHRVHTRRHTHIRTHLTHLPSPAGSQNAALGEHLTHSTVTPNSQDAQAFISLKWLTEEKKCILQHSSLQIHNTNSLCCNTHVHTILLTTPTSMQSEAQNRKEGEEAALRSQAGNKEKEKQPEPGIYGGKNNSYPKIPQDHLRR